MALRRAAFSGNTSLIATFSSLIQNINVSRLDYKDLMYVSKQLSRNVLTFYCLVSALPMANLSCGTKEHTVCYCNCVCLVTSCL